MPSLKRNQNLFFVFAAVALVAFSVIGAGVRSARQNKATVTHPKEWLTSPPPVKSLVKELEIINARLVRVGTDAPGVAFEIRNNSNRGVMAVDIMCGEAGMTTDGLLDDQHPTVVIEPHGTLAAELNDELSPGLPIVLSSATFDDGTEEGSDVSLKAIHRGREHERLRRSNALNKG